ncbi:MAG: phenylalanine--tRNA ligase subunit alpha, partial [Lachnospiraceae bacterium]|nr:phenylalanine--tRNA ligase subunit alpha [Lachnospiraceae bacterium]
MQEKLARIKEEALAKLNAAGTMDTLNEIRLAYLGKKGELTE